MITPPPSQAEQSAMIEQWISELNAPPPKVETQFVIVQS